LPSRRSLRAFSTVRLSGISSSMRPAIKDNA
jgi:hypothetical protein